MRNLFNSRMSGIVVTIALLNGFVLAFAGSPKRGADAAFYLHPHIRSGQTLSDITYRVISVYSPNMDDSVVQIPATGTYTFAAGDSDDDIKWTASVRMDGRQVIPSIAGDYRDDGTKQCYQGKCSLITDASGPFYNPTFWGNPQGELKPDETWTVKIKEPWELGPPGIQTVTVISVDSVNGVVVLKRVGEGDGSFEGAQTTLDMKRDGKSYPVNVKYGRASWVGQAVFQHGVAVSDELLCNTDVELSSSDIGTVLAHHRQFMSLLQHPEPIPANAPRKN